MAEFNAKSICILGRQPLLGLAELESLYGSEHVQALDSNALLDIDAAEINFQRLGGTIKVARILAEIDSVSWPAIKKYLLKNIPPHVARLPEGKFTLGLSVYGLKTDVNSINVVGLDIKKVVRRGRLPAGRQGRPVRVVPNKELALNSAQVLHNKLTHLGAWELLLVASGNKTILAQSMFVQDIDAYAARDQARPQRDSRVGMLPPKLAQIIVNLATGQIDKLKAESPKLKAINVLDPFCGSGVVLQEALLMGYSVTGSDVEPRMIEYSKANLDWLCAKFEIRNSKFAVSVGDATTQKWPPFSVVASEAALGPPLTSLPPPDQFKSLVSDTNLIIKKFLKNLQPQLRQERKICIAVPAWRDHTGKLINLPLIDQISDLGYNWVDFKHTEPEDLVYFREDQTVARRLLVLVKKA